MDIMIRRIGIGDLDTLVQLIGRASTAFWNATLKDDAAAKALLSGDALAKDSDGILEFNRR